MKLLLLVVLVGLSYAMRDQSIAVTGKLMCGPKPAAQVRVKLWEEDSGPDPDDLLDQGYTDAEGKFSLSGGTAELTPIDPVFKIYHDCDDGVLPGSRKVKFGLPKSYITDGKVAKKTFDIGVLNLETVFAKEEREMIVSKRDLRFRRGGANAEMDPDYEEEEVKTREKVISAKNVANVEEAQRVSRRRRELMEKMEEDFDSLDRLSGIAVDFGDYKREGKPMHRSFRPAKKSFEKSFETSLVDENGDYFASADDLSGIAIDFPADDYKRRDTKASKNNKVASSSDSWELF